MNTISEPLRPMHNPLHPGEFILRTYLEPYDISSRTLAAALKVAPTTVSRLINGAIRVSPEMALRLSTVLGSSPRFWLNMQNNYDLWKARDLNVAELRPLELAAA